jgi:peptidase E
MKKLFLLFATLLFLGVAGTASAHLPRIIYNQGGVIYIKNPEISQAFYDELGGKPRDYFINSNNDFNLYLNLLVPASSNFYGRYSVNVFLLKEGKEEKIAFIDGQTDFLWQEFYEPFGRDYYLKGPEFEKKVLAGDYKIEVFSYENRGKYVLVVGKEEKFPLPEILKAYWIMPLLKIEFFKTSVFEFFLTPFGLGAIGIILVISLIIAFINFIGFIREKIRRMRTKIILLTSAGMQVKEELKKLLQKPAYNMSVAYIITASKPEEDKTFVAKDREVMKEMGFNIEDIDIEGKNKRQLMKLLEAKDIIFVQGGNAFYLLKQMRKSGFDKVIKKLLKKGIVYIGASAGSIVAGRTIETAEWKTQKDKFRLKNLKGLNLVPFNIFVHYQPEDAEIIKKKLPKPKQRRHLKILTDEQALLIQGKEVILIGKGEEIKINLPAPDSAAGRL